MFTASHNPAQYNGIKLCRAGAAPVGLDTGLAEIRTRPALLTPTAGRTRGPAGPCPPVRPAARVRRLPARPGRPFRDPPAARRRRRGQRDGRATRPPARPRRPAAAIDRPALLRARRHLPQPRGQPARPGEPARPAGRGAASGADLGLAFDGDADRCFVVDERGDPSRPSAHRAGGRPRARPGARRPADRHPQPDHVQGRARRSVARDGGTPVRTRVGHSFIKAEMAATGAVFGGEHSAALLLPRTSGGPTPACSRRCTCSPRWGSRPGPALGTARGTTGTSAPARSTPRWSM